MRVRRRVLGLLACGYPASLLRRDRDNRHGHSVALPAQEAWQFCRHSLSPRAGQEMADVMVFGAAGHGFLQLDADVADAEVTVDEVLYTRKPPLGMRGPRVRAR